MEDEIDGETRKQTCTACGYVGLEESGGFFYCQECGTMAEGVVLTGVADEDFVDKDGGGALYNARLSRSKASTSNKATSINSQAWYRFSQEEDLPPEEDEDRKDNRDFLFSNSQSQSQSQSVAYDGSMGPTEPDDFPGDGLKKLSLEDYYNEVRIRYVMGLQWMINMQCETLVERFKVSPLICGAAGTIWLRFLSHTAVFEDNWAENVVLQSEIQDTEEKESQNQEHRKLDVNDRKSCVRAANIWFRSLRKSIPLGSSLAITFLACHIAREPILPSDISQWCEEGTLPYLCAHVEITRRFERPSPACPISSSLMFRPYHTETAQKIEHLAGTIAESIGLHLPPVNFHGLASRFLKELSLPVEKIMPHALKLYEWSTPSELWISSNLLKLPSRVCVLAILIVSIRILYDINGFGAWEKSLSKSSRSRLSNGLSSPSQESSSLSKTDSILEQGSCSSEELLSLLYSLRKKNFHPSGYQSDLRSYLQYCKDVVFANSDQTQVISEEEEAQEFLWDFYLNEDSNEEDGHSSERKRVRNEEDTMGECEEGDVDKAIRMMKIDMEENRFCYIPPRENLKRYDYLHYARKRDEGALSFIAHADYYVLLRACAKVAKVDVRIMHLGVLSFERRLDWLENRIEKCLHLKIPSFVCEFCGADGDTNT